MNEELQAGLKNALDRGENIEKAIRSFINAGYNANEVQEAASSLSEGALSVTVRKQDEIKDKNQSTDKPRERLAVQSLPVSSPEIPSQSPAVPIPQSQSPSQNKEAEEVKPKSNKFLWIGVISIALIMVAGIITYILLK